MNKGMHIELTHCYGHWMGKKAAGPQPMGSGGPPCLRRQPRWACPSVLVEAASSERPHAGALVKGGPGQSKPQRTVLWLRVSDGASSLTSIVAAEHVHGIEAAVNTAALVPMLHTDEVLHSSAHCRTSASSQ